MSVRCLQPRVRAPAAHHLRQRLPHRPQEPVRRCLSQTAGQQRGAARRRPDVRQQPLRRLLPEDPARDRRPAAAAAAAAAVAGGGGCAGPFPEGDPLLVPEDAAAEPRRLGEIGGMLLPQLLGLPFLLLPEPALLLKSVRFELFLTLQPEPLGLLP